MTKLIVLAVLPALVAAGSCKDGNCMCVQESKMSPVTKTLDKRLEMVAMSPEGRWKMISKWNSMTGKSQAKLKKCATCDNMLKKGEQSKKPTSFLEKKSEDPVIQKMSEDQTKRAYYQKQEAALLMQEAHKKMELAKENLEKAAEVRHQAEQDALKSSESKFEEHEAASKLMAQQAQEALQIQEKLLKMATQIQDQRLKQQLTDEQTQATMRQADQIRDNAKFLMEDAQKEKAEAAEALKNAEQHAKELRQKVVKQEVDVVQKEFAEMAKEVETQGQVSKEQMKEMMEKMEAKIIGKMAADEGTDSSLLDVGKIDGTHELKAKGLANESDKHMKEAKRLTELAEQHRQDAEILSMESQAELKAAEKTQKKEDERMNLEGGYETLDPTNRFEWKKIHYINLPEADGRNTDMKKHLQKVSVGIPVERFQATSAHTAKGSDLSKFSKKGISKYVDEMEPAQKWATIAKYMSHANLLTKIMQEDPESEDLHVILEDDIQLDQHWKQHIDDALWHQGVPEDWDILKFGYKGNVRCQDKVSDFAYEARGPSLASDGSNLYDGSLGYIIRPKSIPTILEQLKSLEVQEIDTALMSHHREVQGEDKKGRQHYGSWGAHTYFLKRSVVQHKEL